MSFKYKTTLAVLALILLAGGVLWYQKQNAGKGLKNGSTNAVNSQSSENVSGDASNSDNQEDASLSDEDFNSQCENGEWVKIADRSGETSTASGTLHWVDTENDPASIPFKDFTHFLDGKEKMGLIGQSADSQFDKLDLFQGREVEVQGVLKTGSPRALEVSQIRCAGKETDKNAIANRAKMLDFVAANINTIAPEKAKYQKWSPDSAFILDEKDIYVDFYDTIQDDENSDENLDTMHRVLLEMSQKDDGGFDAKVLAYYVPGEDDYVLESGTDKFKDVDDSTLSSYTYDSEEQSWTRD
jgi:hypothetical protein